MEKIAKFFDNYPNGLFSKLSLLIVLGFVLVLITIGLVQLIKNNEPTKIYLFKTEWLSMIVSTILFGICYVLYVTVLKQAFVWYEMVSALIIGVIGGIVASAVAERLFRINRK